MDMIREVEAMTGARARRVGGKHGGEYAGPCPACGGEDRFRVWPEQPYQGEVQGAPAGGYWCRKCQASGDQIQFLIDFKGLEFKDALSELGIETAGHGAPARPRRPEPPAPVRAWTPRGAEPPAAAWREHAEKFVTESQREILNRPEVLEYLAGRGIGRAAVARYRLGWHEGQPGKGASFKARKAWGLPDVENPRTGKKKTVIWLPRGIVIPYFRGGVLMRVRVRRPKADISQGQSKYIAVEGSNAGATMVLYPKARAFLVAEAELDAIMCAEACRAAGLDVGGAGLGSVSARPDARAAELLRAAVDVLVALDFGDGTNEWASDNPNRWTWSREFENAARWPVPEGKDPGEYYEGGGDVAAWIYAGLSPVLQMRAGVSDAPEAVKTAETARSDQASGAGREKGGGAMDERAAMRAELKKLLAETGCRVVRTPGGGWELKTPGREWKVENWEIFKKLGRLALEVM